MPTNVTEVDVRGPRFAAWITTAVLVIVLLTSAFSLPAAAAILTAQAVVFVALTSLVPFPWGYLLGLVIWGLAAGHLNLPGPCALALFLILAALSFLSRLALLGALEVFWPVPPPPARAAAALPAPGPRAVTR